MSCTWLLTDDDPDDREVFGLALQEVNKQVELLEAANGLIALELLHSLPDRRLPRVIFMDLNMPRMDGHECLAQLRKVERFASLPVIIYTTSNDQPDRERAIKGGAAGYISKPTDLGELINLLKEVDRKFC